MFKLFSKILILICVSAIIFSCSGLQTKKGDKKIPKGDVSKKWGKVIIKFRTETQENVYGFNIFRGDSQDGPFTKLNKEIIPGSGTTQDPKSYEFVDKPLLLGKTYYYYLQEVTYSKLEKNITGVNPKVVELPLSLNEMKELGLKDE